MSVDVHFNDGRVFGQNQSLWDIVCVCVSIRLSIRPCTLYMYLAPGLLTGILILSPFSVLT